MPPPARPDPYKVFRFRVEIDGLTAAAFSEVSGLESETIVVEYRTGTDPNFSRKLPGLTKFSNIILKRGITDGSIILLDDSGQEKVRWNFRNGWPSKIQGPHFNAHGSDVAIETLEIAHEGLQRE